MSILLGDNFQYQAAKPLDGRLKYDTLASMKAVADSTMYDGCLAYCVEADKTYQWKSTNTVDTDLGKWREFSSGGGGGHAIEDSEGTALTQRETMQFGDGFNATDDSENEKTVVEPNLMTAADMDDVVTPLPSVRSGYHKYSTEEQVVGTWIDGKPLYQKTIVGTISVDEDKVSKNSSVGLISTDYDEVISIDAVREHSNGIYVSLNASTTLVDSNVYVCNLFASKTAGNLIVEDNRLADNGRNIIATVRYTKTTD